MNEDYADCVVKVYELTFYDALSILLSTVHSAVLVCLYSLLNWRRIPQFNSVGDRPPRPVTLRVNAAHRSSALTRNVTARVILPLQHKILDSTRDHSYGIWNHKTWHRDQQCFFFLNQGSRCPR